MSVKRLIEDRENELQKEVALFNPLLKDFKSRFNGKLYKIKSKEIVKFKKAQAEHAERHLITFIANDRGVDTNFEVKMNKIRKEVQIEN